MDPETREENPAPPPFLFYRRLVAYTVYAFCGLLFMWSVISITVETFWPKYRPELPREERIIDVTDQTGTPGPVVAPRK